MRRYVWVVACVALLSAAVVDASRDELTCNVTFTDDMSWSWGMSNASFRVGSRTLVKATPLSFVGDNDLLRETPAASMTLDLTTKELDEASAALLREAGESHRRFPTVALALMGSVGDKEINVTYELSNVTVSRAVSARGGMMLSLNFEELKIM